MKKLVKYFGTIVCLLIAVSTFAAEKKSIVCVSFPEYDWVCNILGNQASNWNVRLLQNKGTDPHSWQPSFADIAEIGKSDLFVYNGGESDAWAAKALQNVTNPNQVSINLMEALGERVREEEVVEGMQVEEKHHHEHDGHHHHDDEDDDDEEEEEEIEYDEHIWLSLRNAIVLVGALTDTIVQIDTQNEQIYKSNAAAYTEQLTALDNEYAAVVNGAANRTILFGDRFPFRYLADDYDLKYYAAFAGCSAESEASFETIIFLAKKVDELGLQTILTIEKSNQKIAKTIAANSKAKKAKILVMDSLQSVNVKEIKKGKSYIGVMRKNLEILKTALSY